MIDRERQKIRHLLIIKDRRGKRAIPLIEDIYSLGRSQDNSIVLYGSSVSREHATIARHLNPTNQLSPFEIIDGNLKGTPSTNGLLINGVKRDRYNLQHGDFIEFGHGVKVTYYSLFNLSDREFTEFCQTKGNFQLIEQSALASFEVTATKLEEALLKSQETAKKAKKTNFGHPSVGLASFAQLTPHPIVEIDLTGSITYMNPAAIKRFPQLQSLDCQHPIITNLPTEVKQHGQQHFIREIEFQSAFLEQSIQYFEQDGLIRILTIEISQRQQKYLVREHSDLLLRVILSDDSFESKIQSILKIGCDFFALDLGFLGKLQKTSLQITAVCDRAASRRGRDLQDYCLLKKDRVLEISDHSEDRSLRLFKMTLDSSTLFTLQKFEQLEREDSLVWSYSLVEQPLPITTYLGMKLVVGKKPYGIVAFFSPHNKLPEFTTSQIQFMKLIGQCLTTVIEQKQIELVVKKLLKQKSYSQQLAAEICQPIDELIDIVQQLTDSDLSYSQSSLAQALNSRSENLLYLIHHLLATSN